MGRQSTTINLDDEKSSAAPGTRRYADGQTFRKIIMLSCWLGGMLLKYIFRHRYGMVYNLGIRGFPKHVLMLRLFDYSLLPVEGTR